MSTYLLVVSAVLVVGRSVGGVLCQVLNEAVGVLVYGAMSLQREDLVKFKSLRVIISLGVCGPHNIDVAAATQLGRYALSCIVENDTVMGNAVIPR